MIRQRLKYLIAAVLASASTQAPANEAPRDIAWPTLIDAAAQEFEDPYRALEPGQLLALVDIARTRAQLEKPGLPEDRRQRVADRLARAEADLSAEGVDIDYLISQRWIVAERRKQAAMAGNPALDGADVQIAGFVIPAPAAADGTAVAYLVPEAGMCSHMPPPPPNQMIRVRMTPHWTASLMYEPVRVAGRIALAPSAEQMRVVDGLVTMAATYHLDAVTVEPRLRPGHTPPPTHRAGSRPVVVR